MMEELLGPWLIIYVLFVGACVGSFLNVVVARLPRAMSVSHPRSHCPLCKHQLTWYENIPIVSFLALGAKCSGCKAPIAWRYPLVETLMMALSGAFWFRFGLSFEFLIWWPLSAALLAIVFLDIDHWWIPDVITWPAMVLVAGGSFLPGGLMPIEAAMGVIPALLIFSVGLVFKLLLKKEGLGFGDVKLLLLIGLALGPISGLHALFLAALQGAVIGGLVAMSGGHQSEASQADDIAFDDDWEPPPRAVPFGPFLVMGAFQVVLLPDVFEALPIKLGQWVLGLGT
ncbi:MAG: prepilin peptidase [Deltaproteobacteria bacterium]|jgi:leader peptidase (prepilin peptidase) / N-methyltransferase|nr:prepilin peptidase [Deltaproteobacteria bacterium]MBT6492344.1 prepilin peptidase [Deltaproteobacteria bacterium]